MFHSRHCSVYFKLICDSKYSRLDACLREYLLRILLPSLVCLEKSKFYYLTTNLPKACCAIRIASSILLYLWKGTAKNLAYTVKSVKNNSK
jgi:hypothetical protein